MTGALGKVVFGFVAAAISVVLVHESIIFLLKMAGMIPAEAWSMKPVPPYGVPTLANSIFWGGLWGVLFALIADRIPIGQMWLKGLIFGLCILVLSNWLILALIKSRPLFAGFDPIRMLDGVLILSGFGIAMALIYEVLQTKMISKTARS